MSLNILSVEHHNADFRSYSTDLSLSFLKSWTILRASLFSDLPSLAGYFFVASSSD